MAKLKISYNEGGVIIKAVEYSFGDVKAKIEEPHFYTYHWVLCSPQELYREVLRDYPGDIYKEEPVQEFVTQYLRYRGENGIVGLVGLEVRDAMVIIDAAVRYTCQRSVPQE